MKCIFNHDNIQDIIIKTIFIKIKFYNSSIITMIVTMIVVNSDHKLTNQENNDHGNINTRSAIWAKL